MARCRIGFDIGGTFTDVVLFNEETGQYKSVKVSSTPADPSNGAAEGIEKILSPLAATLVDVFGHVEVYQLGGVPGLLLAASAEPLASLEGARRALRATPADFARYGFHRVEDFAALRLLDEAGTRALAKGGRLNTDDHNLLATRTSHLGAAALDVRSARALWQDHDPLLAGIDDLDRSALIRRLVASNFPERATALALTAEGADQETGLGWIELGLARPRRAARALRTRPRAGARNERRRGGLAGESGRRLHARPTGREISERISTTGSKP